MKSFDHWRVRNEAKILNSEKKRTGNELPRNQVEAGGTYKTGPKQFKGQLEGFKSKLSHKKPQEEAEGLGDKGMDGVGKATFDREPVKAGQTPTISNGIPVGELKGQFENNGYPPPPPKPKMRRPLPAPGSPADLKEKARIAEIKKQQSHARANQDNNWHMSSESFKSFKEFAPAAPATAPAVEMGQQDPTEQPMQPQQPAAPEIDTGGLPPAIMRYMDMALKAASNLGPQKLRILWNVVNQKMEQLIGQSNTSNSMASSMRNRQALATRKGSL